VVAFNELRGLLPHRKGVPDLLMDLARMLPANDCGDAARGFGG
jgi:hypothetical protein